METERISFWPSMQRLGRWLALGMVLSLLPAAPLGAADEKTAARPWSVEFKVLSLLRSHSSYEFGNPYEPYQAPLSRLEFPLDSWWGGVAARREFNRFSIGVEVFRNLSRETEGVMADSDWTEDSQPQLLTIYSESNCRLEPSYMVNADAELKVSDWLGLPDWLDLRPVAGVRWQRLTFVSHDGTQYERNRFGGWDSIDLPGDSIRFEQKYWQPFLGLRAALRLGNPLGAGPLRLRFQLDRAWVQAKNEDHHLLREGYRLTQENTSGEAWHAAVGLELPLTPRIAATAAFDYLRIRTEGTHRWFNSTFGTDMTWERGVKVWSEQKGITLGLAYRF